MAPVDCGFCGTLNSIKLWLLFLIVCSSLKKKWRETVDFLYLTGMRYMQRRIRIQFLEIESEKQLFSTEISQRQDSAIFEVIGCRCWLPDPFRGMGAWRKTIEPQKPGNSPGSGPEVVER